MVARLARVCDGYPAFLAARSPSRADWIEILRGVDNWIGLQHTWETLCSPAPLAQHFGQQEETIRQEKGRCRQNAINAALPDERIQDEVGFQATTVTRDRGAEKRCPEGRGQDKKSPRRWAQDDERYFQASSDRAEAVSRWVRGAPLAISSARKRKGGKKASEKVVEQSITKDLEVENGT
jgi:hypothetical protein